MTNPILEKALKKAVERYNEKFLDPAERMFGDWDNNGHEWTPRDYEEVLGIIRSNADVIGEIKTFLTTELTHLYELAYQKGGEDMVEEIESEVFLQSAERYFEDNSAEAKLGRILKKLTHLKNTNLSTDKDVGKEK